MEQGFWIKFQRVKLRDLFHVIFFICALPIALIYRRFRKDLWLICDNENEARDNGYWLFWYLTQMRPEQDVMYAINKKSPDYARVKDLGKVVQYGSFWHWIYYLTASKNISSNKGGKPNSAICYVLEVYGLWKNTRIFLQHGIIKDDIESLHYEKTKMRLFVTSTKSECDYVSEIYGYPPGWVQELGLCRLDNLHDFITKRQVLIMPTWRKWIAHPTTDSYQYENIEDFTKTEYFQYWNSILKDEVFLKLLRDKDIKAVFYPHREMQQFLDKFEIDDENIIIASWPDYDVQELLKESAFLITDYSSVAMDFAYMNKPLVYYQFDYNRYREGHLQEGYFSYEEDGFGPVCYNKESLLEAIVDSVNCNFKNADKYSKRHKAFFTTIDKNNSKRNYEAIKAI
ncbi:MAG: CDP-glycerol glycerophosphotransferase family protein [Candidatus Galacturonibacter soehngenii]|nr:CDP-glycerol glycerophosphotransferase family protein [Candidatus Galacturonibacter soehngenii]